MVARGEVFYLEGTARWPPVGHLAVLPGEGGRPHTPIPEALGFSSSPTPVFPVPHGFSALGRDRVSPEEFCSHRGHEAARIPLCF